MCMCNVILIAAAIYAAGMAVEVAFMWGVETVQPRSFMRKLCELIGLSTTWPLIVLFLLLYYLIPQRKLDEIADGEGWPRG